ncbi:nitrogenase iron-molybdenum cofactor biosynthesis protein NifN [Paenibacillus sp. YN15]|uniref:nitrogenase iron-molybdenum cofactor biosynthesis protein NifN n=1 Tax=Paenibacillus sp. YN15 TaxID=1742774 RepID=UPI0015EC5DF6|nr:nitrogenase iron-molybdenum cofactor biosynthesis protein NifN [Paenibacillus sp. YN15]
MELSFEQRDRPLAINPFRVSQSLGGVLALQGIFRSLPVLHGPQGCAESIQTVLSRHFREPIPLQNIAMQEYNLIFGGEKTIHEVLQIVFTKHNPDVVAVVGSSMTEAVGEDLPGAVRSFRKLHEKMLQDKLLLELYLPDYEGSLESGYARMTEAALRELASRYRAGGSSKARRKDRINLLAGSHLTPGDVMELKEIISSFGLEVIVLPDLSSSLAGHLLVGHMSLSRGGVPLDYLWEMAASGFTLAVGSSMEPAARILEEEFGIGYHIFPSVSGLEATDGFFGFLQRYSRNAVQMKYRWQRQFALDCLLDTRASFRGKQVVAALEPDHLVSVQAWLWEAGIKAFSAVVPFSTSALELVKGDTIEGDLQDLQLMANRGADLWISNSYGEHVAKELGIRFMPMGFPVLNRYGSPYSVSLGYRGMADLLNSLGNVLMNGERV